MDAAPAPAKDKKPAAAKKPAAENKPAAGNPEEQALADIVYDRVKAAIGTKRVSAASVTIMLTAAIAEVEKLPNLTGMQKKALVTHVVDRLLNEIPAEQDDRDAIRAATALMLPHMIDTLVAAANGQLGFGGGAMGGGVAPAAPGGCGGGCTLL
jgi:hypothetical protein